MVTELGADALGEEWKGYVVWSSDGNHKILPDKAKCQSTPAVEQGVFLL